MSPATSNEEYDAPMRSAGGESDETKRTVCVHLPTLASESLFEVVQSFQCALDHLPMLDHDINESEDVAVVERVRAAVAPAAAQAAAAAEEARSADLLLIRCRATRRSGRTRVPRLQLMR